METIGVSEETKDKVKDKRDLFDEQEPYYVGYDKTLNELLNGYEQYQSIINNYSEEQVLALIKGKASVKTGEGEGQGEGAGKGESVEASRQD